MFSSTCVVQCLHYGLRFCGQKYIIIIIILIIIFIITIIIIIIIVILRTMCFSPIFLSEFQVFQQSNKMWW